MAAKESMKPCIQSSVIISKGKMHTLLETDTDSSSSQILAVT